MKATALSSQQIVVSRGQDLLQNRSSLILIEPATLRLPQIVCPIGCFSWLAFSLIQPTSTAESSTRLSYRGTKIVATFMLYNCHSCLTICRADKLDFYNYVDLYTTIQRKAINTNCNSSVFSSVFKYPDYKV
jgi:hypothetical protein